MIRIVLSILILLLLAQHGFSQNITSSDLSWSVSRIGNRAAGEFDDRGGVILSYGTERVEWRDAQGTLKQTFVIREVNGSWQDVARNGSILYEADSDGKSCTLAFQRSGNVLTVTIGILNDSDVPLIYEFTIQNVITL